MLMADVATVLEVAFKLKNGIMKNKRLVTLQSSRQTCVSASEVTDQVAVKSCSK
jgi:hypothetical protein